MAASGLKLSLRDLARFRQGAYRLLAALLLCSDEGTVVAVAKAGSELRQRSPWMASLSFYGPWDRFLRCLEGVTPAQAQQSYLTVFGGAPRTAVPVHESAYLDQSAMASGWLLAELEKEYATAGVRLSSPQREAPDHAAVELEFVSFLCGQETEAWESGNVEGALRAIRRQGRFLEQHPCQWFAALSRAVTARDDSGPYSLAVEAARTLVVHDADFLEALAARLEAEAGDG